MKTKVMLTACLLFALALSAPQQARAQKKLEKRGETPVGLPDLVVTGLEVLDADAGKLKVTVMNKGIGSAPYAELRLIVWDYNGKTYALMGQSHPALAAKEQASVTFEIGKPVSSMKYELVEDYKKKVGESNELNNVYKGQIGKY